MPEPRITITYCDEAYGEPVAKGKLETTDYWRAVRRLRRMYQGGWAWAIFVDGKPASKKFKRRIWTDARKRERNG